MNAAEDRNKPRPPIVEALGSVAFWYIPRSLAAGAVSRKSILVFINNRVAEQQGRVIEVPFHKEPFHSVPQSEFCNQRK